MGRTIHINPIGRIQVDGGVYCIRVDQQYRQALIHIDGFSHLTVIWWGNIFDQPEDRNRLVINKPYKSGPDKLGIFATHSPIRPNPILVSTIYVQEIDRNEGLIYTPYIDAENNSPVIDIKSYHKSERVKECKVPDWCSHWPDWYEDSGTFDWAGEFNY